VASRYPPTPDAIKRKLDSLRPPGASERPSAPVVLEQDEVTGVINLALERIAVANASTAVEVAARRLMRESCATQEIMRSLSPPPSPAAPAEAAAATTPADPSADGA
jgi:hypothetical protein